MTIEEMRKRKVEHGYSYEQIASISGVPLGTVQKILGGITKAPRYDTVKALEDFFMQTESEISDISKKIAYSRLGRAEEHNIPAPSFVKQRIIAEMFSQIRNYLDTDKTSDIVPLMAPMDVRLDSKDSSVMQPDLMLIGDPGKIKSWGILGAPDFVAEVLTPPVKHRESLKRLVKYADAGVREYWILDTLERKLIVYPLEKDECLKVFKFDGRVPIGIYDGLYISLKRVGELIQEYPDN